MFMPTGAVNQTDIDRRKQMAQMLMQQQQPQGQQAGRFYVAPSPWEHLAAAGTNVLGAYMGKQADKQQHTLDENRKQEIAKALQSLSGQGGGKTGASPQLAASLAAVGAMPLDQQEQVLGQMAMRGFEPEPERDPIKLGTGEALIDPDTYQQLATGPEKPATPEKLIPVVGPNGPTLVPQSEAAGMTPYRNNGVSVNVKSEGPIPAEHRAVRDDQGNVVRYERIPGGPASEEADRIAEADANRQEGLERQGDIVVQEIDRTLNTLASPSLPETGMLGNILKGVPGTDAHSVQNYVNTIRANVGFDKLQAMREASPTGGALGQVSEQENKLLQSVLGSLEQSQTREDFEYNMKRLRNTYMDIIHGPGQGPERMELAAPGQVQQPAASGDAELDALLRKYGG